MLPPPSDAGRRGERPTGGSCPRTHLGWSCCDRETQLVYGAICVACQYPNRVSSPGTRTCKLYVMLRFIMRIVTTKVHVTCNFSKQVQCDIRGIMDLESNKTWPGSAMPARECKPCPCANPTGVCYLNIIQPMGSHQEIRRRYDKWTHNPAQVP